MFAVATNDNKLAFPFSTLALNQTACKAIHVSGQGEVEAFGNIQSNSNGSDCPPGGNWGMSRTGGGEINIIAPDATCRSAGVIQNQGSGTMTCTQAPGSFALPDPLGDLGGPAKPPLAGPMRPDRTRRSAIQGRLPGATDGAPTEAPSEAATTPER